MGSLKSFLTFESVDEILWCEHSNETFSAVLSQGTICISAFNKMKFGNSVGLLRVKGVKCTLEYVFTMQGVAFHLGIPCSLDSIE